MRTRVLLVPCLLVVGGAWWLRRGSEPPVHPPARAAAEAAAAATASAAPMARPAPLPRVAAPAPAAPTAESLVGNRLDPRSDAFRNRLDEVVPERLSATAAGCYHGGLKQDQELDLTYRIHVEDGAVSITNLRVDDDSTNDPALVRCIQQRLLAARWKDDELPDIEEDDDLYLSGDSLKRFVAAR